MKITFRKSITSILFTAIVTLAGTTNAFACPDGQSETSFGFCLPNMSTGDVEKGICITNGIINSGYSVECAAAVIADVAADGSITEVTAGICGIAAEDLANYYNNNCN